MSKQRPKDPPNPIRRRLLGWPLAGAVAWPEASQAQAATPAADTEPAAGTESVVLSVEADPPPDPGRLALLVGNRDYPGRDYLPQAIHNNVNDMERALKKRGFQVSREVDLDADKTRKAVERFAERARAAPADATVLFYFTGHGAQINAKNLLVGAGADIRASSDVLLKSSLQLGGDVLDKLPRREQGLTIAVVDACRDERGDAGKSNGEFNQAEAPLGCLIAFSTGYGTSALAPKEPDGRTFYTAALVDWLQRAQDELSFSALFDQVRRDVPDKMDRVLREKLAVPFRNRSKQDLDDAVRRVVQKPFVAKHLVADPTLKLARAARPLSAQAPLQDPAAAAQEVVRLALEAQTWERLQRLIWPPAVVSLADEFLRSHPKSKQLDSVKAMRAGASEAAAILRRNDVRLYRRSFDDGAAPNEAYRADLAKAGRGDKDSGDRIAAYAADLLKAARGDKDAAMRIGRQWATRASSGMAVSRYEGWMQYAAELGNGIASYELALHYRRSNQPQPAARWEARARELGYTPPTALEHTRK